MSESAPLTSRSLTPKGRATRERIVQTAAGLVHGRGVAATSLDDVKLATGVSSSQLYHYFDDRHELIAAVIEHQRDAVLGFQLPRLEAVGSLDGLRGWRDAVVAAVRARQGAGGCPVGSLAAALSEQDAEHRAVLAAALERWQEAIRAALARVRDAGEVSPEADLDALAVALLSALQGGLLLAQVRRDAHPLGVALDEMLARIAAA
jgi:TetR/AcrR family transcriptional regulator, transcriptional repressor for nem operon